MIDLQSDDGLVPPHQLLGLDSGYIIRAKVSLDAWVLKSPKGQWKRKIVRWLIRELYNRADLSGDFQPQDMGIVTSIEVARSICAAKNLEAKKAKPGEPGYGWVWEFKELGVNQLLGHESVHYGMAEYPATTIDDHLKARKPTPLTIAPPHESISELNGYMARLEKAVGL